jgi:hypothetical protein
MELQHLAVTVLATENSVDLGDVIPVFQRWIQDSVGEELWIDVADYRHVPGGPGVLLVAHEANYNFNARGLTYTRKTAVEGANQDKLLQAFFAALEACHRLEEAFPGALRFNAGACEVTVNDRLIAPNTDETWQSLQPEFRSFFETLLGCRSYQFERRGAPRERFRVAIECASFVPVASLLEEAAPA